MPFLRCSDLGFFFFFFFYRWMKKQCSNNDRHRAVWSMMHDVIIFWVHSCGFQCVSVCFFSPMDWPDRVWLTFTHWSGFFFFFLLYSEVLHFLSWWSVLRAWLQQRISFSKNVVFYLLCDIVEKHWPHDWEIIEAKFLVPAFFDASLTVFADSWNIYFPFKNLIQVEIYVNSLWSKNEW